MVWPISNAFKQQPKNAIRAIFRRKFSESFPESTAKKFVASTYGNEGLRSDKGLVLEKGEGVWIYDSRGQKFLDFAAGIAVSVLGHGNKKVQEAVADQMGKIAHSSNIYHTGPALRAAEKIVNASPGMSKIFFTNSGTESNEGAIKFSKIYSNLAHGGKRRKIIAFKESFHGRSLGALSCTYKPKIRVPFEGLTNPNVVHLPFNDVTALKKEFENSKKDEILALIMEPVQGEGGITPATIEFAQLARKLCDESDASLIFDEVQIGFGRCGNSKLWAYEVYDVVPDILTCAKPIAAGLPMGAILLSEKFMKKIESYNTAEKPNQFLGLHGSTFAGNPVCCRAAEVVVDSLTKDNFRFLRDAEKVGADFISKLEELKKEFPEFIQKVNRPLGDNALYAGLKVNVPVDGLIKSALHKGLFILSAGDYNNIVRICPPLVITSEEIAHGVKILREVFSDLREKEANVMIKFETKEDFASLEEYNSFIAKQSTMPKGFSISSTTFAFKPRELPPTASEKKMSMSLVKLDKPSAQYGAVFTKNRFPGAPVKLGREIVNAKTPISALLVNNKISNVHPKGGGVEDAKMLMAAVKKELKLDANSAVFPSSTGVIGWRLPIEDMQKALPNLFSANGEGFDFAKGIMTTDRYPKSATVEIHANLDGKEVYLGRITGFAKGAGMIEPNMGLATMLVFIFTDIDVEALKFEKSLQNHLESAINVAGSLNRISVDSAQSTSDTVLLISSAAQKVGSTGIDGKLVEKRFQESLSLICKNLAHHVVRNGEGVEHVMKAKMNNCPSESLAALVGRRIVNSPLVKTAVAGNDPNVGRIIAAIGNAFSDLSDADPAAYQLDLRGLRIKLGDHVVFEKEEFCLDPDTEKAIDEYFKAAQQFPEDKAFPEHSNSIDIEVDMNCGSFSTEIIGADLTHAYVKENAEYRS